MMPICVALVEDDETTRTAIYALLTHRTDLSCVVCASSAEHLLHQLEYALAPQVILLDIHLPGMSGLEAIPHILKKLPDVHILIHTVFDNANTIYQALCLGAMGYLLKGSSLSTLAEAVLEVVQGGTPFSRTVSRKVLTHFKPTPRLQSTLLGKREQEVLNAMVDGLTSKQVAAQLGVGLESIRTYTKNIYQKLHISSRAQLLNRAMRGQL